MSDSALPWLDTRHLAEALETDAPEILRDFYSLFHQQLQDMQTQLDAWQKPLDIAELRLLAHKLKSSSRTVGALALGEQLETLEHACVQGAVDSVEAALEATRLAGARTDLAVQAWLDTHHA